MKNMLDETQKSAYDHVVCDSDMERSFADQLEKNDAVCAYSKGNWLRQAASDEPSPARPGRPHYPADLDFRVLRRTRDRLESSAARRCRARLEALCCGARGTPSILREVIIAMTVVLGIWRVYVAAW